MKYKYLGLVLITLLFLTGCKGQKEELLTYLKENDYSTKNNCLQKSIQKDNAEIVQRFCLDECKYYAMNKTLDDYFTMDLSTQEINYIFDYITYQYDTKNNKTICLFQGEEIDKDSSYCKNAKLAIDDHLSSLKEELNKAEVNIKYSCK